MKTKLIAFDLDGTLLTSDKKISDNTYKALEKAAAMGIVIVPCTGRFYEAMPNPIKTLPFVNYSINCNGAVVFDLKNKKTIYESLLPIEESLKIIDYFDSMDVAYDAYVDNWGYMPEKFFFCIEKYVYNKFYIQAIHEYRKPVSDLKESIIDMGKAVQKLQFFSEDKHILQAGNAYLREHFPTLQVTSAEVHDTEINSHDASKGTAILKLAQMLGIKPEETMAFGDGGNDISMLESVGFGVCMGNGKDIAKEHADFVTKSNDEDGIVYALEKFVF